MAHAVEKRMGRVCVRVCEGGHTGVQGVVGELGDQGGRMPAEQYWSADPLEVVLREPALQSPHLRPKALLVQLERFIYIHTYISTGIENELMTINISVRSDNELTK